MKRKIFLFTLLSVAVHLANASNDTVRYGDSCYLFNPISPTDCRINRADYYNPLAYVRYSMFLEGYEYVLPSETTIYGIAATIFRAEQDTDSAGYTMYLYVIENDTERVCVDSITSYSRATYYMYSAVEGDEIVNSAAPCYEYFFSQPHVMSGTIYIGARWDRNYSAVTSPRCSAYDKNRNQRWIPLYGNSTQYDGGMSAYWGGYFPIIRPERIDCEGTVAEVSNRGVSYVELEWDMDGDSCQLAITPYDMPVDSGLVIDLQSNSYTATGLDSGVYYAARLRTQCHHRCHIHADTVVWGGWGAPALFYLGSVEPDTTGVGIHRADAPISLCITPNPTTGALTVSCEAAMEEVELYDMQGRCALSGKAYGTSATLDLTALPAGSYVLEAHTAKGMATRTVEKR